MHFKFFKRYHTIIDSRYMGYEQFETMLLLPLFVIVNWLQYYCSASTTWGLLQTVGLLLKFRV